MRLLFYVTYRSFCNRLKKALKRPVTYLFLVLAAAYAGLVCFGLYEMAREIHVEKTGILVIIMTVLVFLAFPSSYWMYARRKGIIFRPSHTHFIFTAPVSPKQVLLYGAVKNMLVDMAFGIAFFLAGSLLFEISPLRMLLVFLAWEIMTILQEGSLVVLLYGNENVSAEKWGTAGKILLGVLAVLVLFLAWYFWRFGLSLESIRNLVDYPALRLVPLIGWNIAVFRLFLLGPDLFNVAGSLLCLVSSVAMVVAAVKMPCYGEYSGEAAQFADDYQNLLNRKKKGETGTGKEKYRKVKGKFQATGAKAIFYRQFLEYRKSRFFIFNQTNVICIVLAFVLAFAWSQGAESRYAGLVLLCILAYVVFCTAGYAGKWEKELENPWLYLIPEKPVLKMWYATLMEHICSLIDGTIMCVVIGVAWKIPVWQIPCCILIYVLFQASRMYMRIFALYILGDHFGTQVRQLFRMLIQSSVMGPGIALAIVLGLLVNVNLVFPILLFYSMIVTVGVMFLAASRFEVLEQLD